MAEPSDMRWWGWGEPGHPPVLGTHARGFLRDQVGIVIDPRSAVGLQAVRLPVPSLPSGLAGSLRDVLGQGGLRDDHLDRVVHAGGKGYLDLVRLRAGAPDGAPDAVCYPSQHAQVRRVLELCAAQRVAVVPFGGGTSVVGGLAALRGESVAVLSLDLRRLGEVGHLDRESLTVHCEAGMRVAALEPRLRAQGLTLGHFPQSYEYLSLGGAAATRSAGQASTGYGRFDDLVLGLRCATPSGDLELAALPGTAAGPDLRELVLGSEGVLGVITDLALRLHLAPQRREYEGAFFETFAGGAQALRALIQHGPCPDVVRLSDEQETGVSIALAGSRSPRSLVGRAYLRLRGYAGGCLAILGFEGGVEDVARRREQCLAVVRRHGGLAVGRAPAEAWVAGRFAGPYLRDDLLDLGVMVETLETAAQWSKLTALHRAVTAAIDDELRRSQTPGLVMCHVSHLYESGASLYFTILAAQHRGGELAQWQAIKQAASRVIVARGATITHHHGVGRDHAAYLPDEVGAQGLAALRSLKAELDPAGIMNPGKLLAA